MADIFGDDSLFSEFERDRDEQNIFIHFDQDESGVENRSRIVFRGPESDEEASDDEGAGANEKHEGEVEQQLTADSGADASNGEDKAAVTDFTAEAGSSKEGEDDTPQTTSYQEQFQKNKLRQFARLIDSTRCVSDEQSPGIQIVFQNNKFSKRYRSRIEQFIVSLIQHADRKDFSKTATDLSTKSTTVPTCVDINDSLPVEKRNNRMWQAHGIIGCAQFHNCFMVDCKGWPHDEEEPKEFPSAEIPKYFQVFDEVFPPDEGTSTDCKKPAKPKDTCFNCGGDHRLNECVLPKDHNRIRAKRRERQENSSRPSNPNRYHEDPELDPQKAKFVAGTISEGLRDAMGLKAEQLPSYIYRMRMFGYPPGWLKEANRKISTLAMYDKDGRETNLRGESLEDGEYSEQTGSEPAESFDINKIIEYPGFTVPVPLGVVDESESLGMPSIQQHQLKKTLMEDMVARQAAKKRRREEDDKEKNKKLKTEDKDVGEGEAAPVQTSTPTEGDKRAKEEGEEDSKDGDDAGSPTMDTLQQEYKKLVKELDSEAQATETNGSTSGEVDSSSMDNSLSESQSLREKNFSFTSCSSISRDFGTPILVREKSFKSLPSAEKFSQGVEDHIPFENLPDSVGTFEKMRNLFSLIRNKIKKGKK